MGELELVKFQDPDPEAKWQKLKDLALNAVFSPHTIRAYDASLEDFRRWQASLGELAPQFNKAAVNAYRAELEGRGLSASSINIRLSAIRKLVSEAADNGWVDSQVAAAVSHIKGVPRHGVRMGNWLTKRQAERLIMAPDSNTVTGKRDRALLGALIGCALRRGEALALTFEHIQQREGRWVIVDLLGKHHRVRQVPMEPWVKALIDIWAEAAGGISTGHVFRPVNKGGRLTGDKLVNGKAVWTMVQKYCAQVGVPKLAPHDLRRTHARVARAGGAPMEQIQHFLGHASIQTTERYVASQVDLQHPSSSFLGLDIVVNRQDAA